MTIFQQKTALRQKVKLLLNLLTAEEIAVKSAAVWAQVERLQEFKSAKNILAYASLKNEVQTHDFMQRWSREKNIFLPIVHGHELRVGRLGALRLGSQFGILEPEVALAEIPPLDLAIVPGMAFDRHNHRLGRGKGFYDRLFSATELFKVGVCFSCQLFDEIPHDAFDVSMDTVLMR